jgi:hypothetical protein
MIKAVEQEVEKEVHLALVLEDDPGRELGLMRQPGPRFFTGSMKSNRCHHRYSRRLSFLPNLNEQSHQPNSG